jgi:hypothetical protein
VHDRRHRGQLLAPARRAAGGAPDGAITGSLADGCLEKQLASEIAAASGPVVKRFGAGSELIDFRLPCGSGLDVLIDPAPDRARAARVRAARRREAATLRAAGAQLPSAATSRRCAAAVRRGPELEALVALAGAAGSSRAHGKDALALGRRRPGSRPTVDRGGAAVPRPRVGAGDPRMGAATPGVLHRRARRVRGAAHAARAARRKRRRARQLAASAARSA